MDLFRLYFIMLGQEDPILQGADELCPLLSQIAIYTEETIVLQGIQTRLKVLVGRPEIRNPTKPDLEPRSLTLGLRGIACGESTSGPDQTFRVSVGSAKQEAPSFRVGRKSQGMLSFVCTAASFPPFISLGNHAWNFILVRGVVLAELNEKSALPMKRAQE